MSRSTSSLALDSDFNQENSKLSSFLKTKSVNAATASTAVYKHFPQSAETLESTNQLKSPHVLMENPSLVESLFDSQDPHIRDEIIRLILQYLQDEGFHSSRMMLHDEAQVKWRELQEQTFDLKRLRKAILDGDWSEVEKICCKSFIRNQRAFLYAIYKQQFLELIEHRETQKAFMLLNKKLKPMEHLQATPHEFRDLCYLLTSKSIQDVASFKYWDGVSSGREKLCEQIMHLIRLEDGHDSITSFIPPHRLLHLLKQAVAYQVEFSPYHSTAPPKIHTLLSDYRPPMIPNCCLRSLRGHRANIKAVIWSGSRLITGSSDHTIRIWPTYRPEDVNNSTHAGVSTAPSPVVLEGHDGRVWDFAVSKAGSTLASASGDATLKIWDLESGLPKCTLWGHDGDVYAVDYHADKRHIGSGKPPFILFEIFLTSTGGYDKTVRIWDVERQMSVKSLIGHGSSVSSVLFNPFGNLIISGSKDSSIKFWDIMSGICIKTISSYLGEVTSIAVSPNGLNLLSSSKDNSVRLWDIRMVRPMKRFKGHQNTSKNFIRAGFAQQRFIWSGSEDGLIYVWDAESGELVQRLHGHAGAVYSVAINDDLGQWASISDDETARLWWFRHPNMPTPSGNQ